MISETSSTIFLPDAPAIPGLSFRGFAGRSDFPKMAAMIAACKVADRIERAESAEDIERNYQHLVKSDPATDMIFAQMNGEVIGYGRVSWRDEVSGDRIYNHFGFLRPDWRRQGIGRAMLHYNQRRLLEIADEHPTQAPAFFDSFAADTEVEHTALLLSEGYLAVRHGFQMVHPNLEDIPEAPMPVGLEVRPSLPDHFQAIKAASFEAFRDHWGATYDDPEFDQMLADPELDPSLWRVAWEGDQVAGMVLSFIDADENREYNRKRGYTENIAVRRPWRRRGLARSLLVQSLHAIKERGMTEGALGVDSQNLSGALHLYESVGFRVVKRDTAYRKPVGG